MSRPVIIPMLLLILWVTVGGSIPRSSSSSYRPPYSTRVHLSEASGRARLQGHHSVEEGGGGMSIACSSAYELLYKACENTSYGVDEGGGSGALLGCCHQLTASFSLVPRCYCEFAGEGLIMNASSFCSDARRLCGVSVPPPVTTCLFGTTASTSAEESPPTAAWPPHSSPDKPVDRIGMPAQDTSGAPSRPLPPPPRAALGALELPVSTLWFLALLMTNIFI